MRTSSRWTAVVTDSAVRSSRTASPAGVGPVADGPGSCSGGAAPLSAFAGPDAADAS